MQSGRRQTLLLAGVIVLTGGSLSWAQVIGFWEFDERSPGNYASTAAGAIVDSSGANHHLTATGSPEVPFYVEGSPAYDSGSALNFLDPEDDRLFYPDGGGSVFDFDANDSFTIEAVIGSLVQPDVGAIVAKDGVTAADPQWWFRHENGQLKFLVSDGPNVASVNTGTNPLAVINDGAWHHVAAVRDAAADALRLYVDYQLVATSTDTSAGSLANGSDMTIGAFANSLTREFGPGDIDFVKITAAALDPAAFEQILPEPKAVLASWEFEEGTPGTPATGAAGEILDSSGNGRHADAVGDPNTGYPTYVNGQCVSTALQFNSGLDAVQYPFSAPYPFDIPANGTMTFELVLRTSASGVYQAMVSRDDASAQYWSRIKDDDTVQFFVSDGTGNGLDSSAVLLNDGQWHHVAFVRDGRREQLRYYVDYELVARRGEPSAGLVANAAPLTIAEFAASTTRSFVGEIDLVRVSQGALEPDEFASQCPDLRADLDNDYDVDLADYSIMQMEFTGPR